MTDRVLVVGVGTPDGGDDAVGPVIAEDLARRELRGVTVLVGVTPMDLLDVWDGAETVVLVDALRSGDPPGTLTVWDATSEPLPGGVGGGGTHGLGVADMVELARQLGRLPGRLVVVGVELASCAPGAPLSPAVRNAVAPAVGAVLRHLPGR